MTNRSVDDVVNTVVQAVEQGKERPTIPKLQTLARSVGFTQEETKLLYTELVRVLLSISISPILLPYPIAVYSPTADIVAFNGFFKLLYGLDVTDPKLTRLNSGLLGPNILRLYFDETYKLQEYFGGYERWRNHVKRNIKAFQVISKAHTHTDRYIHVVTTLAQLYPEFIQIWDEIEREKQQEDGIPVSPFVTIFHPLLGGKPLRFAKFELPQNYLATSLHFFGHFPDAETLGDYFQFFGMKSENKLYDFLGYLSSVDNPRDLLIASSDAKRYDTDVKEIDPSDPHNGEYPEWVVEEANSLVEEIGGTFEEAISTILRDEKAWMNRVHADPQEPVRTIFTGISSQLRKKS
jgi:hypothetical protein